MIEIVKEVLREDLPGGSNLRSARSAPRPTSQVTSRQPLPHFHNRRTITRELPGTRRQKREAPPTKNGPAQGEPPGQGHKDRRVGLYAGFCSGGSSRARRRRPSI
ncbi:hypothetical protein GCM10010415_57510 [Streptomyces atrovirens]